MGVAEKGTWGWTAPLKVQGKLKRLLGEPTKEELCPTLLIKLLKSSAWLGQAAMPCVRSRERSLPVERSKASDGTCQTHRIRAPWPKYFGRVSMTGLASGVAETCIRTFGSLAKCRYLT